MRYWWNSLTDKTRYGLMVAGYAAFITFSSTVVGKLLWG